MTEKRKYQMKQSNFFNDFSQSRNKLKKYFRRTIVIDDLIYDTRLRENYDWNLKFVTDFHQICEVAFPTLMKIDMTEKNYQIIPKLTAPNEEEKKEIVRNRIRMSIPFFNVKQLKEPPILLPMYHSELMNRLESQFYEQVEIGTQKHIYSKKVEINNLRTHWINSLTQLKSIVNSENLAKTEEEVRYFSDLTTKGSYYLFFINLIGTEIVNFLLHDPRSPHVKIIGNENKEYAKVKKLSEYQEWYYKINKLRKTRFTANINDAMAISVIITWNRILGKKGTKEIYFLLSDAELLWNLLRGKKELPDKPIVNNKSLPSYYANKINILRTSYHFEEYIMAFDKNPNLLINKLEARKRRINDNLGDIIFEIEEVESMCINEEGFCQKCEHFEKCRRLKSNIDRLFSTENEFKRLLNIINKENTFKALLKFTNKYISSSKKIKNIMPNSIFNLEENYLDFFTKSYGKDLLKNFERVKDIYQEKYFDNIKSIYIFSNIILDETNIEFRNRLERIAFLNIKELFKKNSEIKNFLRIPFEKKYLISGAVKQFSYKKEIIAILEKPNLDIEAELFIIIILFCQEKYKCIYTLANHYISDKKYIEEIKSQNLELEFQIILNYSKFMEKIHSLREKYNMIEKMPKDELKEALNTFNNIFEDVVKLENKFYKDPRVFYFIAKIYSLQYFFKLTRKTYVLEDSIKYLNKAICIVKSNKKKDINNFSHILFLLYKLKLWCILNISVATKTINAEIESLYKYVKNRSFYYTKSEYFYYKFLFAKAKDKLDFLKSSISEMEKAINLGEKGCNSYDELEIFRRRRNIFIAELENLKN